MSDILVGCGQITWSRGTPEELVLAEIAQAGYDGAPAYPHAGQSPPETVAFYARYGLKCAPGYFGADFWRADQRDRILEGARRQARFMRQVGCTELYVAAGGFEGYVAASGKDRKQVAGHVSPADGLTPAEFRQFADTLNRVGELTLQEGVRSCFHNHVGSVIETGDEMERLLALVDPALVFLGPDTGHLAWGGEDAADFCRRYAARIQTLHVKDVDAAVLARGVAAGWDYDTFAQNGLFAELGEGCIDFPAIFDALRAAGFAGWVITETDVTQKPTALQSVTISRRYLRSLGL